MIGLLGTVAGIAVIDSINPSALLVTLYLLLDGRSPVGQVLAYVTGVFVTYLVIGVLLMVGLDAGRMAVGTYVSGPAGYAAQGLLGAALVAYSFLAPSTPPAERTSRLARLQSPGALFALGASVTVVEFATALPYLGAIAILTNADLRLSQWVPILLAYNGVFVLPPLALLLAYQLFGRRLQQRFERWRERLQRGTRAATLWIVGLVGGAMLADSVVYFLVPGRQ